ncbi:MAG TPA: carboxymuconolactone decarboxylase family protein [Hanamia sp.]
MTKRIAIKEIEPEAYKAMLGMEHYTSNSKLPQQLRELIKIRASQINNCAYCIDMHTEEALKVGETQRRIFAISAWKESPLFTEEERAVLQLTEEITLIAKDGVRDETYKKVLSFYDENEVAKIIMQIIVINSWNRIAVSTKMIYK